MRKTTLLLLSTAIAAGAFSFTASADRGHGMFDRADADKDGFVTKQEFAASRDVMFQGMDADKDGNLTLDEMEKARAAWHQKMGKPAGQQGQAQPDGQPQSQAQPGKRQHRFMERVDTDKNGVISVAEFNAAGDRMFTRLDDNGDGKIAKDEVPQRRKHKPEEQPAQ